MKLKFTRLLSVKFLLAILLTFTVSTLSAQTTYYWVGGSGTWGTSSSFATVSGATGSALLPGSTDIVIFDGNSGNPTVTVSGLTISIAQIQITGSASVTLSGAATSIALSGNLTIGSSCTLNDGGNILTVSGNIVGSGTHAGLGRLVLTNGKTIAGGLTLGNVSLQSNVFSGNVSITGDLLANGTSDYGGNTVTVGGNIVSFNTTPTIGALGNTGKLVMTGASTNFSVGNLVLTASTGTSGYTTSDVITFTAPQTAGGITAKGIVSTVSGGVITAVAITDPGSGYTSAPTVASISGVGTGATLSNIVASISSSTVKYIGGRTNVVIKSLELNNSNNTIQVGTSRQFTLDTALSFNASNTSGKLAINSGSTLIIGNTTTPKVFTLTMASTNGISTVASGGGNITVSTTSDIGSLYFDQTTPSTTNRPSLFTLTAGTVTLGNNFETNGTLTLTAGTLKVGSGATYSIRGTTITRTSGVIDASASGATVSFTNSAVTIASGLFSPTTITNMSVAMTNSVTLNQVITITNQLSFTNTGNLINSTTGNLIMGDGSTINRTAAGNITTNAPAYGTASGHRVNISIGGTAATAALEVAGTPGGIGTITLNTSGAYTFNPTATNTTVNTALTLAGGSITISTGKVLIMANGSTVNRNSTTGSITATGTLQYGTAGTDRVNIGVNPTSGTVTSGAELNFTAGVAGAGIGTLTVASGAYTFNPTATTTTINTALTLTGGTITISTGKTLQMANGSTINRNSTASIITATGTLQYGSASSDRVNVAIAFGTGNTASSGAEITGGTGGIGSLTITSGTYTLGGNVTINNGVSIASGGILDGSSRTITLAGGNWSDLGSFTVGTSTVTFSSSSAQSIAKTGGETFNTLNISSTNIVTLNNPITTTTLVLINGELADGGNTITVNGSVTNTGITAAGAGTITYTNGGGLLTIPTSTGGTVGSGYLSAPLVYVASSNFGSTGGTGATASATFSSGSVSAFNVVAAGTGYSSLPTVIVVPNVKVTGSGGIVMNANGGAIAGGTFSKITIAAGTSGSPISTATNTIMASGATFTVNTGAYFTGNNTMQFLPAGTPTGTVTVNGTLATVKGNGMFGNFNSSFGVLYGASVTSGLVINFGTGSTAIYNNTIAQTISALTYHHLIYTGNRGSAALNPASNNSFQVNGNLTFDAVTSGAITSSTTSTITFGGTGTQTLSFSNAFASGGTSTYSFANLTINSGATITPNVNISVTGILAGTGTFSGSTKIIMNVPTAVTRTVAGLTISNLDVNCTGTGAVTINGTPTTFTGTVNMLAGTVTYGASATGVFGPLSVLSVQAGTVDFNSRSITLKSASTGTASISTIAGTLSNASNVTIERYIASGGRRSYVLVGAPLNSTASQTIKAGWQENATAPAGFGTLITGGAAGGTNGFDNPTTSAKSIYTYNDALAPLSKWVGLANTDATNLNAGTGFLLYVRGDRTIGASTSNSNNNNTVLRATGTIQQGDLTLTLPVTGADKYNLIANSYPCAIDWNASGANLTKTNLKGSFTVYDANLGSFVSSDGTTKTPSIGNQQAGYIQSGQAFFVQNLAAGASSIKFTEAAKTTAATTTSATTVFGEGANKAQLNINVYRTADNSFADGAVAIFGSKYQAAVDANEDITKFTNLNETFGLRRSGTVLGLEARPKVSSKDTMYFSLSNFAKKAYSMVIDGSNLTATTAKLEDKFTGTSTAIDVAGTTTYNFNITDDAASSSNDRFIITFGSTATSTVVTDGTAATSLYVKMCPNPVRNQLQVSFKTAKAETTSINVVNSLGQVVKTVNAGKVAIGNVSVPVAELATGVYTVQLISAGKVVSTQQVVKAQN